MFRNYIVLLSELKKLSKTTLFLEDVEIHIQESSNKKYWVVSAQVFKAGEKRIEPSVFSCGLLKWQDFGPYLKVDSNQEIIRLFHQIKAPVSFTAFRIILRNFLTLAKEWSDILSELACNHRPKSKENSYFLLETKKL